MKECSANHYGIENFQCASCFNSYEINKELSRKMVGETENVQSHSALRPSHTAFFQLDKKI
jgi:hypothetical protein